METKHTPGQWISREVPPNGAYSPPRRRFKIETDIKDICTVNIPSHCPNEEAEANAKLIEAAPIMLVALKALHDLKDETLANGVMLGTFFSDEFKQAEKIIKNLSC